jgi:hypothetical protein
LLLALYSLPIENPSSLEPATGLSELFPPPSLSPSSFRTIQKRDFFSKTNDNNNSLETAPATKRRHCNYSRGLERGEEEPTARKLLRTHGRPRAHKRRCWARKKGQEAQTTGAVDDVNRSSFTVQASVLHRSRRQLPLSSAGQPRTNRMENHHTNI